MESKGFSVGAMLKNGWSLMKKNIGTFVVYLIIYLAFVIIPGIVKGFYPHLHTGISVVIQIACAILGIVVYIGVFKIALKAVDGKKVSFVDLFTGFKVIVQWIVASIIYSIIVIVGLFLLIIPGLIWGAKFFLWPFVIIDKEVGPVKALEMSSDLTMGVKWDVFLMMLVSLLITFLGVAIVFIGWFAALPVTILAQASMYRLLESQKQTM